MTQRTLDRPDPTTISDLRPRWHLDAACNAAGADRWFPAGQGAHARSAKAICATCPVVGVCLDAGLWDQDGIWGGAGEGERRTFRRVVRDRPHGAEVECAECRWCAELTRHRRNLAAIAAGGRRVGDPAERFGDGATHGRRVTYARGCRCSPCSLAASLGDEVAALFPIRPQIPDQAEEAA